MAELAAVQDALDTEALFLLGVQYCTGRNVAMDRIVAHNWFNLAAIRGDVRAREWRAELAQEMSAAEIAEAQRQAREWTRTH
jgi:TPR repeat protein